MRSKLQISLILLLWPACAWAQLTRGTVAGTVQDASGASVPKAQASAVHEGTNAKRTVETNESGGYLLAGLEPGVYALEFSKAGFETIHLADVRVTSGEPLILNQTLAPAGAATTITVEANATELARATPTVESVLGERAMQSLPLAINGGKRDVVDLMLLTPSVVRIPGGGNAPTSTGGQRAGGEMFQVDGMDNRDPWFAGRVLRMQPEGVAEMRVQTNAYSAEYGRSGGAQISIVSRAGGNRISGAVWNYFGANWLSAATPADKFAGTAGARFQQHVAGADAGGPIRRDRTFFFAVVEAEPYREGPRGNNASITIPTADGYAALAGIPLGPGQAAANRRAVLDTIAFLPEIYPLVLRYDRLSTATINGAPIAMGTTRIPLADPTDGSRAQARIDHRFSERDSLTGMFQQGRLDAPYAQGALAQLSNNRFLDRFGSSERDVYTAFSLSHTRVFSSRWVNELRLAQIDPFNEVAARRQASPQVTIGGAFQFGTSVSTPLRRAGKSGQLQEIATLQLGRHNLKAGMELERVATDFLASGPNLPQEGLWVFNSFSEFLNDLPSAFRQSYTVWRAHPVSLQQSYFVQDDVRLRPELTVNIGVRYQTENVPEGLYGATDPALLALGVPGPVRRDTNNWAPRLGFAFSPRSGRTVFRGGFGISYIQDAQSGLQTATRNNYPYNALDSRNQAQIAGLYPAIPSKPAQLPPPTAMAVFTNVPVDNQDPTVHFYSASVQRQFGAGYFVEVGYTGNHSYHLLRYGDRNPAILTGAQAQIVIATQDANRIPAPDQRRMIPSWGSRATRENTSYSNYNAGYARFDRRIGSRLFVGASYTWSAALDGGDTNPQNLLDYGPDYGRAAIDRPHRLVAHSVWQAPSPLRSGLGRQILGGWQIGGYSEWQSGDPFTITTGVDSNGDGVVADRPDYHPGGSILLDPVTGDWRSFQMPLNGTGLMITPTGSNGIPLAYTMPLGGNLGRNTFRGPSYASWNVNLSKTFSITERLRLSFRASTTNLMNHRNFGAPNAAMNSPTFGQNTPPSVARATVLSAKIQF